MLRNGRFWGILWIKLLLLAEKFRFLQHAFSHTSLSVAFSVYFSIGCTSPWQPCLSQPVQDYLLPMWYGTVLRIWPQQDSWMRPLLEGWGGGRGWGWDCVIVSTTFHTSGPKTTAASMLQDNRIQKGRVCGRACDMGVRRVHRSSSKHPDPFFIVAGPS